MDVTPSRKLGLAPEMIYPPAPDITSTHL